MPDQFARIRAVIVSAKGPQPGSGASVSGIRLSGPR